MTEREGGPAGAPLAAAPDHAEQLERTQRDNIRLANELKGAHDEIERLRRENLSLESRWWKFWK